NLNQPPMLSFEKVANAAGSSAVHANDTVMAAGWAADWEDGTSSTRVDVSIDGGPSVPSTPSNSRPDVAEYYRNPAFTNSGWSLVLNLSGLALGSHTVRAVATDSAGATSAIGSLNFSIVSADRLCDSSSNTPGFFCDEFSVGTAARWE